MSAPWPKWPIVLDKTGSNRIHIIGSGVSRADDAGFCGIAPRKAGWSHDLCDWRVIRDRPPIVLTNVNTFRQFSDGIRVGRA